MNFFTSLFHTAWSHTSRKNKSIVRMDERIRFFDDRTRSSGAGEVGRPGELGMLEPLPNGSEEVSPALPVEPSVSLHATQEAAPSPPLRPKPLDGKYQKTRPTVPPKSKSVSSKIAMVRQAPDQEMINLIDLEEEVVRNQALQLLDPQPIDEKMDQVLSLLLFSLPQQDLRYHQGLQVR